MLLDTFDRFGELLRTRLERGVFTTEDSVRYTFFAALLGAGAAAPDDVVLEYRHPTIAGAEVDTWIPGFEGRGLAVEFKYDRDMPSGKNSARTHKAGKVLHDIYRLGEIDPSARRVFVYATGPEMASYFGNASNGLSEFFGLSTGATIVIDAAYLAGKAATLLAAVGRAPDVAVKGLYSASLPRGHEVRAFEVLDLSGRRAG